MSLGQLLGPAGVEEALLVACGFAAIALVAGLALALTAGALAVEEDAGCVVVAAALLAGAGLLDADEPEQAITMPAQAATMTARAGCALSARRRVPPLAWACPPSCGGFTSSAPRAPYAHTQEWARPG